MEFGTFDQGTHTGPQLFTQCFDAVFDHDAVFSEQRHDISDSTQSNVIEDFFQPGHESAVIFLSAVFDECVGEFECRTGTGEQLEIFQLRIDFGVDNCQGIGQFISGLVVIGNDDIDTFFPGDFDGIATGYTAVNGDQYAAITEHFQSFFQRFRGESVTVIEAVGDE